MSVPPKSGRGTGPAGREEMNRRSLALSGILAAGFLGEFAFALLLLPLLQHYLPAARGLSVALPGYVLAVYGLSRLVGQVPLGALADVLDHRLAVAVGYAAVLLAGLAFWPRVSVAVLFAAAAIYGLGHALADPIAPAALAQGTEQHRWGRALGLLALAQLAGLATGLAGGAFVADFAPPAAGFLLVAAANGLVLLLLTTVASPLLTRRRGDANQAESPRRRGGFLGARVGYLLAAFFTLALAPNLLTSDLSLFAAQRLHTSMHVLAIVLVPAGLAGVAAILLGGWLADRAGRLPAILGGAAIGALALAALTHVRQPWLAGCVAVFVAAGLAVTMPASNAALLDEAQPEQRPLLLSAMMASQGLAQALGPFLGGVAIALGGGAAPVAAGAVALWLSVPLAVLYVSSPTDDRAGEIVAYTPLTRWLSRMNSQTHVWYAGRSGPASAADGRR